MKISIFSESYFPFVNGVSVSIRILKEELERRGHEVWVYAPAFKNHQDEDPHMARFPSVYTPFEPDYPLAVPVARELFNHWRERKFDLVHTHTPFSTGIHGMRWARRMHVPIVSTFHTLYEQYLHYVPPPFPVAVARTALRQYLRRYYSRVAQVVTPSELAKGLLASYGVKTPVTVIRNAVLPFPDITKEEARRRIGAHDGEFVLLYVGRLAREKNVGMLMEACGRLFPKYPQLRLRLLGDGPEADGLRAHAARLSIDSRVVFEGPLPRERVSEFLLACDLFAFPSTTESQGMALDEAQAAGLPCVVTDQGGSPEAVQHMQTGIVTPAETEPFANAIERLLSDDALREELAGNGLKKREGLSVKAMGDKALAVYNAAMNPEGPALSERAI